jgi:hypothetical protein
MTMPQVDWPNASPTMLATLLRAIGPGHKRYVAVGNTLVDTKPGKERVMCVGATKQDAKFIADSLNDLEQICSIVN